MGLLRSKRSQRAARLGRSMRAGFRVFVLWKGRIIWLAVLSVLALSIRSSRAQGGPPSGLYEIISGRYTECCGIGGTFNYPLPNASQGYVELIVDSQRNLAQTTFLGQDMHTVFRTVQEPGSGFTFAFRDGTVLPDHMQFGEIPLPPVGDRPYFGYTVSNSMDVLRINGMANTLCDGCADIPTQFGHTNVVAVLMSAAVKPRLSLPATSTDGVFGFIISGGRWGQTNVIESSTDLNTWNSVSTNVFPPTACPECPLIEFRDPASTNLAHRFYRSFSLP
jgi:hypothetical protein